MESFLDKVRSAFTASSSDAKGAHGAALGEDARTRTCVNCDKPFGPELPRHHCRICDRTVCVNCCSHFIPQAPLTPGCDIAWLRVCDFCYHLREPLLAESSPGLYNFASTGQHGGRARATDAAGLLHAPSLMTKPAFKQVPGDLTWDVPPELEHDFGFSQEDKQRLLNSYATPAAAGSQQAGGADTPVAAPATPREPGTSLPPLPRSQRSSMETPPPPPPVQDMQGTLRGLFAAAAEEHLQALAAQLLFSVMVGQPEVWVPVLSRLAVAAVMCVDPQLHLQAPNRSGAGYALKEEVVGRPLEFGNRVKYPDPCDRIKVKKILGGGSPVESNMLPGVVCKRNLARKNMQPLMDGPCKVVLVSGGIDSSKSLPEAAGGSTLHTFVNVPYEQKVLKLAHQVVARLLELDVKLVLVEGLVAGKVMEYMASQQITLVHNLSKAMLERLAPCVGCDITDLTDWEKLTTRNVGVVRTFRVDLNGLMHVNTPDSVCGVELTPGFVPSTSPFASSTQAAAAVVSAATTSTGGVSGPATTVTPLTHLIGNRPLAATILLRGSSLEQLIRIKQVTRFLVLAAYHARLECSFLAAEMAAALAAVGEEVPLSVALGGLDAYKDLVRNAILTSLEQSASRMPNGLMLTVSPHISMWDSSLADEYEDVLKALESAGGRQVAGERATCTQVAGPRAGHVGPTPRTFHKQGQHWEGTTGEWMSTFTLRMQRICLRHCMVWRFRGTWRGRRGRRCLQGLRGHVAVRRPPQTAE